jgi:hypothetical protein
MHPEDRPRPRPPWVPLLKRLTEISLGWGVWKNADQAISVSGDIDSISPPVDRPALLREFLRWAAENDMAPTFLCGHLPGSVLGVAVRGRELVELQLCEQAVFRGARLFTAEDVRGLMMMDPRGFRRLRPGSEGLLLLFFNAMMHGGRLSLQGHKSERLLGLMRDDPEGLDAATSVFRSAQEPARRLAAAVLDGSWDRRSAVHLEMWAMTRALSDPPFLAARVAFRVFGDQYCPLLPVLRRGRIVNDDLDAWIPRVRRTHTANPSLLH